MAGSWDEDRTDDFTGAQCRPMEPGKKARVVVMVCQSCDLWRNRPELMAEPVTFESRWWKPDFIPGFVAVGTDAGQAAILLTEHHNHVHAGKA